MTNALVDFVTDDLVPPSVVDSSRFKKLLGTLDPRYQLPSHQHLSTVLLKERYDSAKSSVVDELKEVTTIYLTIDLWSCHPMRSHLGITGHYISELWTLESVILHCGQVTGKYSADNITLQYEKVVSDFDVREKVKHIITNSGANVKKGFLTLPGYEDDTSISEEEGDSTSLSFEQDEILFEHHACFVHMLQLVVKDGMAKAGQINTVIRKCSDLISFLRRSTVFKDKTTLQADNVTRWNSQLKTIRSVLSISERNLIQEKDAPKLTSCEQNILQEIVQILTPFEEAMDFIQVGCVPSTGYVLPCIRGLNHHVQSVESQHHSELVLSLKQSLKKHMLYYEESETYILAAILDPRFKLYWCSDDAEKQKVVDLLKSALEKITPQPPITAAITEVEGSSEPPVKRRKGLFNFMNESSSSSSQSQPNTNSDKIDDYFEAVVAEMTMDPADFWQDNEDKYPLLSRLAKDVLGVPCSSAPVERLFSSKGKVFTPESCQLSDAKYEQLMFIRCNYKHSS